MKFVLTSSHSFSYVVQRLADAILYYFVVLIRPLKLLLLVLQAPKEATTKLSEEDSFSQLRYSHEKGFKLLIEDSGDT